MKILLFGATGNVGRCVVEEALKRGHQVTGVVRDPQAVESPDPRVTLRRGDATDRRSVAELADSADAVVSAISPRPNARGLAAPTLVAAARALIAGLRDAGTRRVIAVGGAGSLEVAPGKALVDQPGFPDAYKAEALDGRDSLEVYRKEAAGLDWTFISPAVEIAPGERKGRYRTTDDAVLKDANGKSFITFEDLAVAIVDELERPRHVGRRFGVAY
jgi:putative NADH-flavin reductase